MPAFQKKTWKMKLTKLNMEYLSNQLRSSINGVIIIEIFFLQSKEFAKKKVEKPKT